MVLRLMGREGVAAKELRYRSAPLRIVRGRGRLKRYAIMRLTSLLRFYPHSRRHPNSLRPLAISTGPRTRSPDIDRPRIFPESSAKPAVSYVPFD